MSPIDHPGGFPAQRQARWEVTLLMGAAGIVAAAWATAAVASSEWLDRPVDRITSALMLVPAWLLPIVGIVVGRWRPLSRSGPLACALAIAWATWVGLAASAGVLLVWSQAPLVVIRPLAYWLALSWPSGRLRRGDARWLALYAVVELVVWGIVPNLLSEQFELTGDANPIAVASIPRAVEIAYSFTTTLIIPVGAVALALSMALRYRALPASARYLAAPVVLAAVLLAVWDVLLPITSHLGSVLRDADDSWTPLGNVYVITDMARFALLPVLLSVSALRIHRLARTTSPVREIDLADHATPTGFASSVSRAFAGEPVLVAFAGSDGSWLDPQGHAVELVESDPAVTVIERDGNAIAAVKIPDTASARPALVEGVVAGAGASVELERLEALARSRSIQASRARRALLQVGDETTRRIQRDLHDGAQQRLVGLMLQARLAARSPAPNGRDALAAQLDEGVTAARADLRALVDAAAEPTGGRSLDEAIHELLATVPFLARANLTVPSDLPADVRSTAWFVASEATANAVKHSQAQHLQITGLVEAGELVVTVADDGCGNASIVGGRGLTGLRRRVEQAGGRLTVHSAPGLGTSVRASLPLGASA